MEELVLKILGEIGPQWLGWILAFWLFVRLATVNERATAAMMKNADAMGVLTTEVTRAMEAKANALRDLTTEIKILSARGQTPGGD